MSTPQLNRVNLDMSIETALMALVEGNPGAVRVCLDLYSLSTVIDPSIRIPIIPVLWLDSLGIYGERIWMLYKDVCSADIGVTLAVLRAWQLHKAGVDKAGLDHAIDSRGEGLDVAEIVRVVTAALPGFDIHARRTEEDNDEPT